MSKLTEYVKEQPAVKKFGLFLGICLILFILAITAIFQDEVIIIKNKFKDWVIEMSNGKRENPDTNPDSSLVTLEPSSTPILHDNTEEPTQLPTEEPGKPTQTPTLETSIPDTPVQNIFTNSSLEGELNGTETEEKIYRANITGKYRFDFGIDDVNKSYSFSVLDSKQEEVGRGSSSDSGITLDLQADMDYTLFIEHSNENEVVKYDISINVPEENRNIQSKIIEDKIKYIDQENEYTYLAPKSGVYRFDFDIDDVNKEYSFLVYDSKNEELLRKSSSEKGGTLELFAGQNYKIKIVQQQELPNYSVKINEPNNPKAVVDNLIKGKIKFIDQLDVYNYVAPRTGVFRFDFGIDNVNKSYDFLILNKKKEKIVDTNSYNCDGKTIELEKGEKYQIQVKQDRELPKYNIKIHVPNLPQTIYNGKTNGVIQFTDQEDIYFYTASKTGTYRFQLVAGSVENSFSVSMYDSKDSSIFEAYATNVDKEIELKKNQKYKLVITYFRGFGKYKVIIDK